MKKRRYLKKEYNKKLIYNGSIEDFNEKNMYTNLVDDLFEENQIEDKNAKSIINIDGDKIIIKIKWLEDIESPDDEKLEIIAKRAFNNSKYKNHIVYVKSIYEGIPIRRVSISSSELSNDYTTTDKTIFIKNLEEDRKFILKYDFDFISKFREEVSDIIFDFFDIDEDILIKLFKDDNIIDLLLSETKVSIFETFPRELILNTYEKILKESS